MKKNRLIIWSLICASLILLFTTRSSPLFVCNNWDDVNSYFTMGKGMMNGLVIYRDLYDQKGPFLYLLYGIAYLISNRTFLGVFIFEVIAATFFLYFAGKLIEKKSNRYIATGLIPVIGAAVYSSWSFYSGGAAEEFCLPLLALALYLLDEVLQDDLDGKRCKSIFGIAGICAGVVAQVKYTMLGFFFAWFILAVIWMAMKRDFSKLFSCIGRFIVFAIVPSVPWFIYFVATGSLDDWYRCYIYNNLFFYSHISTEQYSFLHKIYEMTKTLYWLIRDSFSYFIWIIAGFILQLVMEKKIIRKLSSLVIFGFTYFVIFIGGNKLAYYSIPLMPVAIIGAVYVGMLLTKIKINPAKKIHLCAEAGIAVVILAMSTVFAACNTQNAEYRGFNKEDVWLFEAAKYLDSDDTLLELNAIDAGLYTVSGIVPSCEYFQTNGIGLDMMFEEQKKYLKEGRTDYVLAVAFEPEFIDLNYCLVDTFEYNETDHEEIYYLYRKKD